MKVKKILLVAVLALFLCSSVYADGGCRMGKGGCKMTMSGMFMKKAHMALMNAEEIGLTEEQQSQIKDIKIGLKKQLIKMDSEIELLDVDIKSMMMEDVLDATAVEAMIDNKYNIKKEKAVAVVRACDKMRKVLSADQIKQMKDMCNKTMK